MPVWTFTKGHGYARYTRNEPAKTAPESLCIPLIPLHFHPEGEKVLLKPEVIGAWGLRQMPSAAFFLCMEIESLDCSNVTL